MPKLTVERIKTLQYPDTTDRRRYVLWDAELPGFVGLVYFAALFPINFWVTRAYDQMWPNEPLHPDA